MLILFLYRSYVKLKDELSSVLGGRRRSLIGVIKAETIHKIMWIKIFHFSNFGV